MGPKVRVLQVRPKQELEVGALEAGLMWEFEVGPRARALEVGPCKSLKCDPKQEHLKWDLGGNLKRDLGENL